MATNGGVAGDERAASVREFDDSKSGVKALVDAGITSLPPIFRHTDPTALPTSSHLTIPTVDLSLPHAAVVDLVRAAACDWGFFQLVNHDIPLPTIERTISAARSFHELPAEARSAFYTRDRTSGVAYFSNVDLLISGAASWRDTLELGAILPDPKRIPAVCRAELLAWDELVTGVARRVMELLCEGLGVEPGRLEEMTCLQMRTKVCHYYPQCPEPDATVGIKAHTDPSVLTVLVQDRVGGLLVKGKGDDGVEAWAHVKPIPGALVINIGDILQLISNDVYKSTKHQVLANPHQEARVSVGTFFNPAKRGEKDFYGPLPELISPEKPAVYRNFTIPEYMGAFFGKELSLKTPVESLKKEKNENDEKL